jgi:hypothetical protein
VGLELAQRLVVDEALPRRVVEAALLHHAKERLPFVLSLLELYPHHAAALERELALMSGEAVDDVSADPHLMARLPLGLCSRLLGFPIGVTSSTGVVDVLVVDPLDQHTLGEFGYHLAAPVRLVRGRHEHVLREVAALEGELGPRTARQDHRRMNEPAALSAPPIPLTRVAGAESELHPGTTRGVAPPFAVGQVGAVRRTPAPEAPEAEQDEDEDDQIVPPEVVADAETPPPSSRISLFAATSDELQSSLSDLAVAETPDDVVDALVVGLGRLAKEVWVFSVRSGRFKSRARTDLLNRPRHDTSIELPSGTHALSQALELGQYLGPMPDEGSELGFLGEHYDELCVSRVDVMEHPTLVLVAGGFLSAYDVSLRSDHLARAASDALARIVLAKKH